MKTKMVESQYKEMLKESITVQWDKFEYFRNICKKKNRNVHDLIKAIDYEEYYRIPAIAATAFKKSKGLLRELNDFSQKGKFQVSSNTSGDPSYVFTNQTELDKVVENYRLTFGIEGTSRAIGFSPSMRILEALSKKSAYMGYQSIGRMNLALEAANIFYRDIAFTLDVDILRTLFSRFINGKVVLKKIYLDEIIDLISCAERDHKKINLGGFVLLLNPYLDQLKEGQFSFGPDAYFTFAGGGYSGAKGSIKGVKVNKPEMIKKIASVFGIDKKQFSTNLKDIYAFTECSATNEGYWNEDFEDYLFETWHETRAYVVDPETEEPLKSGEGVLKFITPYGNGNPSAANVSVLQFDNATIRGIRPNYIVSHFSHIKRFQNSSVEGCAYKAEEVANKQ
jgi:hypothetical protein